MKFKLIFISAILGALVSFIMLFIFYNEHRQFTSYYKHTLSQIQQLEIIKDRISINILKTALFAYNNQDIIQEDIKLFQKEIKLLENNVLIQKEHYSEIKKSIISINRSVEKYVQQIYLYMMLNGGIKNSYIFLSSYSPSYDNPNRNIMKDIVNEISKAKRTLDASFLNDLPQQIKSLEKSIRDKKDERFILHAKFISDNFAEYINTFHKITNLSLTNDFNKLSIDFESIAKSDFEFLNEIALTLFIMILIATLIILGLLIFLKIDNQKLKKLSQELDYNLAHDTLTSLKARNSFIKDLQLTKHPTIILININKFKIINDLYGNIIGDKVIKKVTTILKLFFGKRGLDVYRISGDEFSVIFEEISLEEVEKESNKIINIIDNSVFNVNGINLNITISLAISKIKPYLETADMALKHLKSFPNTSLIVYNELHNEEETYKSNIRMIQIVKNAITENKVIPFFQPIVDIKSNKIVKYEALVRILDNEKIISPFEFLPIIQNSPLYFEITKIMISKSVEYFKDKEYRFSINLSMKDLLNDEILHFLTHTLSQDKQTASKLDIELLESENLYDLGKVKEFIEKIREFGTQIAIDDFGSGYSNFMYIPKLSIDIIKIDGSLIKDIDTNMQNFKTTKAIAKLAHELGIVTIAEFVQNEKSVELLKSIGISQAQGYHFGKPTASII